jgi:hypothetical protein
MSSIVVAGDTSGSITLQAPATAGSTVLTLPTTSATLITNSSGILNIGSGQVYKDASGNVGIGTTYTSYGKLTIACSGTGRTNGLSITPSGDISDGLRLYCDGTNNPNGIIENVWDSAGTILFRDILINPSGGNVGIGTSSPAQKLTVSATTATQSIVSTTTGNAAFLVLQNSADSSNAYVYATGKELRLSQADTSASSIVTVATQNIERMRIDASGNVGIGGANYGNKLALHGGIRFLANEAAATTYTGIGSIVSDNVSISTAGTERMRIDSSGTPMFNCTSQLIRGGETFRAQLNAGIASFVTSQSAYPVINLKNSGTNGYMMAFTNASAEIGTISSSGSNVAYNTSSDYRLKDNVEPMVGALNTVAQLNPVNWKWKADGSDGQGFIAHELQAVVPACVTGEKDAVDDEGNPRYQGIDTSFLVATLTAAIQEQQALITHLQTQITALNARLTKAGI